ncbi:alkaline phosphatase family protein [Chthoniobacter flavus]|nr:alkaline phosphatase family protein [Chthoniobacter flavus]
MSLLRLGRCILATSIASLLLAAASTPTQADEDTQGGGGQGEHHGGNFGHGKLVNHVLLISVDGLHQSDLASYIRSHPKSTLAALAASGVNYINASTPFPSDSFPGMVGQATGGNPSSTGIYYDDTWNRAVFPAGTINPTGPAPGAEVTYFEQLDLNLGALDAGQGIVPAPGNDPWANILQLSGNPVNLIDPKQLPVDAHTGKPIYPGEYLRVNTIFEVAHEHHLLTAWSDKHPAYQILSGPSGLGVDDYFTPEINSSANPAAPTDPNQNDWTTNNLSTQQYDNYKVQAVINWINGHRHDGSGNPGTPAIFGMNFQTVSTAQKLPTSPTNGDLSGNAPGGYLADGATPGTVLSNALDFVDRSLGSMVAALQQRGLYNDTAIIISAKHGQSPMNPAALNRIKDSSIIDALNAAWKSAGHNGNDLVPFSVNDDGMLIWIDNQWHNDPTAAPFAKNFLLNYNVPGGSVDGKDITSAGLMQVFAGAEAAEFIGANPNDPRLPDVIGIAQYGVVYTSKKSKISEHGGGHPEDRNVPILLSFPNAPGGSGYSDPVETTQIAPTILRLLGLNPNELQAVRLEGTQTLF